MAVPIDTELYEKAKAEVYKRYSKPSAYRSGALVKRYKELGGRYKDSPGGKPLKRWFQEDWKDVGKKGYPVYRPTKRISSKTPLTPQEIDPQNLQEQIDRKQEIKGERNLKPFVGKGWENIYGRTGFHAGILGGERPFNTPNKPVLNISEQDFFDPNFILPQYYYDNPKQVVFWNDNYNALVPDQNVLTNTGLTFGSNRRRDKRNYVKGLDDNRDARMVNAVNPLPYETQPNITAGEAQILKDLRKRKYRRYAVMNSNELQRIFPANFLPPNYLGQNLSPSEVLRRNWLSALTFAANAINQQGPPPPPAGGPPPPPPPPPGGDDGPSPSSSSSRSRSSSFGSFPRSPSMDFFRGRVDDNDLFRRSPNSSVSIPRSDSSGSRSRSRN